MMDVEGHTFMDCLCGAGVLPLGHNHPAAVQKIWEHLDARLPMQTLDLMTPVKDEFVEHLLGTLPEELARDARIQFCSPSGADVAEAALKLVKTAARRSCI